jgi:capsid protein
VYELWLEEAINKGLIEAPNFYENKALWTRCKWIGPGRGWIDPVKEAKASQLRLETGLSTLEDECATQGLDWEEVLEQRAREQTKMRELGLAIQPIMPEPVADPSNSQPDTEPDHPHDEANTQTNTPV